MIWLLLVAVGAVIGFLTVEKLFRLYVTPQIADIFEKLPPFNVLPAEPDSSAQLIHFRTSDGLRLTGSLLQADQRNVRGLVLFLPELNGTHWMARQYCQALLDRGFCVLAFDFRNQGDSECLPAYAPLHWITEFEMTDVAAVMDYIASDPRLNTLPMAAFGVSRGGGAALLAACRHPRIRAVICDSGYGTMAMMQHYVARFVQHVIPRWVYRLLPQWHIDVTLWQALDLSEARRRVQYAHLEREVSGLAPSSVLLISGGRDSYVTPEIAGRLRDEVGHSASLWIADGAKHNMSRQAHPDEYDRRIVEHVETCLFPEKRTPAGHSAESAASRRNSLGAVAS